MNPVPQSSCMVREIARAFVSPLASPDAVDAILIAVTEAVSNCVRHARTPFKVQLIEEPDDIVVVIADAGHRPFDGNTYVAPEPGTHEGKIGIPIMRAVMDHAEWSAGHGTTVTLRKSKHNSVTSRLAPIQIDSDQLVLS